MEEKKITIFTPTYNRGDLLNVLYESLLKQEYKNFEWLIVDDGSSDNTKDVVNQFISEKKIDIKYIFQKNGGKHRAINTGIKKATGDLFFIVDSDDYLTDDALITIIDKEKSIKESNLAGLCFLRGKDEKNMIGTASKEDNIDLLQFDRKKYGISGDKAEVFYTKILKKYKFSEYENEKFLNECIVWNKIAFDGYKLRYFNKIIYICDYLENGLTKNIKNNLRKSPKGFLEYINQLLKINKNDFLEKIKLVSFYYDVMNEIYSKAEICKQLNVSRSFLNISIFIRKLFKRGDN